MARKRCRLCGAIILGRGVEAVFEHMMECEEAISQAAENGGDLEVSEVVESLGSVVDVGGVRPSLLE